MNVSDNKNINDKKKIIKYFMSNVIRDPKKRNVLINMFLNHNIVKNICIQ